MYFGENFQASQRPGGRILRIDERGVAISDQRDGTHDLEVEGTDIKGSGRVVFDVAHHGLRADGIRDYKEGVLDGMI